MNTLDNQLDLNLNLLSGDPIIFQNICSIYPLTLREMKNLGFDTYNKYLSVLCMNLNDLKEIIEVDLDENINIFEIIYSNCKSEKTYKDFVFEALKCFLKEEVNLCEYGFFLGSISENRIINKDNFNGIVKIIKLQNCLIEKEIEEKIKPANERARKMLEQMKKNQEELNKVKNKNTLNIYDLISIFAAYSQNINIFNVWDLSFYQFDNQFNRLTIMKEYNANLQILMHCDTSKNNIELKHWLSPNVK